MPQRALSGWLGRQRAVIRRTDAHQLALWLRGREFDLLTSRIDHRVDGRRATLTAADGHGTERSVTYRWRHQRLGSRLMDYVDYTADEPWTWEDGDFGERIFHIATGTGPVKYRFRLDYPGTSSAEVSPRRVFSEGDRLVQLGATCGLHFERSARLDDLCEASIKFEVAGIWSEPSLLVLRSSEAVLTVALTSGSNDTNEVIHACRRLPGWGAEVDASIDDAVAYGGPVRAIEFDWPQSREERERRHETVIWRRPER